MIEYEYSDSPSISVDGVRSALLSVSHKFELNSKACAVEVFEDILKYFHEMTPKCSQDCYTHGVFGFEFTEEVSCKCDKTSGEVMSDYIIRSYLTELYQIAHNSKNPQFDVLLGQSLASQSFAMPCLNCTSFKFTKKILKKKPKIFCFSFTWAEISQKNISWFASLICPVVFLRNLFSLSSDQMDYFSRYIFKGMVCYVASHYVAFFYSMRRNVWVEFDDSTVMIVYDWSEVLGKVITGKMAPVMLFYELDEMLDMFKRQYQLEYLEHDEANYLLDPENYFDSFADVISLDLAGLSWKSELLDTEDSKKCLIS